MSFCFHQVITFNLKQLYKMFKKILISMFFSLVGIVTYNYYFNIFTILTTYFITVLILILGSFIYPLDLKFKDKIDFMIFPILVVIIFNIVNLFFLKKYSNKIDFINIILGLFGVLQFLSYRKKNKF